MKRLRNVLDYALYVVVRVVDILVQIAGEREALFHARRIARIWWALDKRHRNVALTNLRNSFPDWSEEKLARVGKASFESLVCFAVDVLLTPRRVTLTRWQNHVRLVGFEKVLEMLLTPQRPMIMLTAHYSNFEIMGFLLATLGFPTISVARPIDNPRVNDFLMGVRERNGQRILDKVGATAEIPDLLAANEVVCFIADQNAGHKGQFVNFFGRPASTYKSIALLAMQHECPIVVGYARRARDFIYEVGVEEIIFPEHWQGQANPVEWITQRYADAMERFIRRDPTQYWWVHRRWKSRPPWELPGHEPAEAGAKYHPRAIKKAAASGQ